MIEWFLPSTLTDTTRVTTALDTLITASFPGETRQILEEWQHILLEDSTRVVLCLTIAQHHIRDEAQAADELHAYLRLLEDAHTNGISEAFQRFSTSARQFEISPSRTIQLLTSAIGQIHSLTYPYLWAELHSLRGASYMEVTQEETRAEHIEQAIKDYDKALTVFTQDSIPGKYAQAHMQRGFAHSQRIEGERAENLEQAIADFDSALVVLESGEKSPDWAVTHMLRGLIYIDRIKGERDDNLEKAIAGFNDALTILTHEGFPAQWALIHMNRGFAYMNRVQGERAERIE